MSKPGDSQNYECGGSCGSAESAEQLNFMVLSEDGMSIYIGSMRCSRKI